MEWHPVAIALAGTAAALALANWLALPDPTVAPALVALACGGLVVGGLVGHLAGGSTRDRVRTGRVAGVLAGALVAAGFVAGVRGWVPRRTHSTLWELHFLVASNAPPTWLPIPDALRDEVAIAAVVATIVVLYAVEGWIAAGATGDPEGTRPARNP